MAHRREPIPVVPIVAVISRYQEARDWAMTRLTERFGEIAECSEPQAFEASGYYDREMGEELQKQFVRFQPPTDPVKLATWKIWTNQLEAEFAAQFVSPAVPAESRPLNLDPGYVTEAKLVLATTKDRDHRIYLCDGIYAEVTLSYTGRRWTSHRWTYPDYRTELAIAFVERCRLQLREHLPGWQRKVLE
ncbi:DUF4416 family protein [Roseimaritima ulvae]|uniref:DUF4416 domain-containing protein n=1 Tax=Roseimaritima ulvae TaxID=980254 RepID=A0A5B9R0I7_9BACT|nr:DUF4416 family protein [Roseimaritima ulvae]QEG42926.1 hypothetical protein UC8_49680 [Roseimaritima ulvae]